MGTFSVIAPHLWENVTEMKQVERTWIRPGVNDLFDLEWSPDSTYIAIAAISGKGEVIRIANRDSLLLPGHTSYVQGVAWDPLNKMIATQSSDRSCKIHMVRSLIDMFEDSVTPKFMIAKVQGECYVETSPPRSCCSQNEQCLSVSKSRRR